MACNIYLFMQHFLKGDLKMPAFLQTLLSSHGIVVAIALFSGVSAILTAIGAYLKSIGDVVPGWLGSVISGLGSVLHVLNGLPSAAVAPVVPPQS
jgi:hypothetical protein